MLKELLGNFVVVGCLLTFGWAAYWLLWAERDGKGGDQ